VSRLVRAWFQPTCPCSQVFKALPMLVDRAPTLGAQYNSSVRLLSNKSLFNGHQSSRRQLGEVCRQVASGQPCDALKEDEVSAGARGERSEDDQAGRLVHEPV
jgi:hypothetical protein